MIRQEGEGRTAHLAQSVERQPFKLVVKGSSPLVGAFCWESQYTPVDTGIGREACAVEGNAAVLGGEREKAIRHSIV